MAIDVKTQVENQKKMDYAYIELTKFLKDEFNLKANIPYSANNRLSKSLGRFKCRSMRTMVQGKYVTRLTEYCIEYNAKFLTHATKEQVAAVGKHEALHFATHTLGLPCTDGSEGFENMLKKYNLPSHSDPRTTVTAINSYIDEKEKEPKHYAICSSCNKVVATWKRKPNITALNRKQTNCCHAKPIYAGKLDGTVLNLIRK